MSELQIFLLAVTGPLAVFAYSLHHALRSEDSNPNIGIVAFISMFMITPPNS